MQVLIRYNYDSDRTCSCGSLPKPISICLAVQEKKTWEIHSRCTVIDQFNLPLPAPFNHQNNCVGSERRGKARKPSWFYLSEANLVVQFQFYHSLGLQSATPHYMYPDGNGVKLGRNRVNGLSRCGVYTCGGQKNCLRIGEQLPVP